MASFTWITLMLATLPLALSQKTCDSKFEYELGVLKKLDSLEKDKTHLATELNVHAYTNRALADQVTVLTGHVTALTGQVTELVSENKILNTTVNELQAHTNTELAEQVTELLLENRRLNTTLNGLLNGRFQSSSNSSGSTYIRWGRTSCPSTNQLVYEGYAGGSHHTHAGGGANYLCLPKDPMHDKQSPGGYRAYVYGAEYETGSTFWKTKYQNDVPCAVCRSLSTSILMIPARNDCYTGWTTEYSGYLMAGYYGYPRREYVCVDGEPEVITGTSKNVNGALFYFVTAQCGSLPCPPYKADGELTCVVCSYELRN